MQDRNEKGGVSDDKERIQLELSAPSFFTLNVMDKESYVVFYDYPTKEITNFACQRLMGKVQLNGKEYWHLSCWEVENAHGCQSSEDYANSLCISDWYYAERKNCFYLAAKSFHKATERGRIVVPGDKEWNEKSQVGIPKILKAPGRIKFLNNVEFQGPLLDRKVQSAGLWEVKIGKNIYKCIRAMQSWPDEKILYETLIDIISCRSVVERRYNGPGWMRKGSTAKDLRKMKCPSLTYNGITFYLWYDIIPAHSLLQQSTGRSFKY